MATMHYSIPRFYGARYGTADNLVPLGYASAAQNVDTSDGALQSITGAVPFPDVFDDNGINLDPRLMWVGQDGCPLFISSGGIAKIQQMASDEKYHALYEYTPASGSAEAARFADAAFRDRLLQTQINGEHVVLVLMNNGARPYVVGYDPDPGYYIRSFGSGQFLTSDAITQVFNGTGGVIVGVSIGRVMTEAERQRCLYAGVYVMAQEDEELDYTAVYVSECRLFSDHTTIVFKDSMPAASVEVGHYVKVRGGLSDRPIGFAQMFYGRMFAGGDPDYPNRLYWSCLPGDGRTIEDWSADDASPDTGGGYIQVGDSGLITALVVYQSQLLIWKGDELWRLYGATPSQYTLELVYSGAGQRLEGSFVARQLTMMQERIVDVHGVPYFILDDGLYYYNGSSLSRVDTDDSVRQFLQVESSRPVSTYQDNLHSEISSVQGAYFWRDSLYFSRYSRSIRSASGYGKLCLVRYNLVEGSLSYLYGTPFAAAFRRGLVVKAWNGKLYLYLDGLNYVKGASILGDSWLTDYRKLPIDESPGYGPIDAYWESSDLSFGDISAPKKLSRIGFDVTGPIRVIVTAPEGTLHDKVLPAEDDERRMLWLQIDMPYESTFRIRFESVEGRPFRVNNGVDFYIETRTRS